MGKGKEKAQKSGRDQGRSSHYNDQADEQKQLWELNDVIIQNNYSLNHAEDGSMYYALVTDRTDLPLSFWYEEWRSALDEREQAEVLAISSGRQAQETRQAGGAFDPSYQLPSQQIANNPSMDLLSSSARAAKAARKDKKKKRKG